MRIMISNDDGILAPGIQALIRAFVSTGHEIYVCAPDAQRSAASHSLSLRATLSVKEMQFDGVKGAWAIGGTPADCVKLGLKALCPQAEFVVSGINHGCNAGSDVLYSGTVAAAMEGALCGLPSMAVSLDYSREDTYDKAAALAVLMFDQLLEHPLAPGTVFNLNYPAADEAKGVVATGLKKLVYNDDYFPIAGEDGVVRYELGGSIDDAQEMADDDYTWLRRGYATATVVTYDMTDKSATQMLKSWL